MTRIIFYNSKTVVLAGLVAILDSLPNLEVVGSFTDEASLIALNDRQLDLLLLERTPEEDLWWLEQWLSAVASETKGILITDYLSSEELGEYLNLGFRVFLPRLVDPEEVIAAIEAVSVNLIVIHPELASFGDTPAIMPLAPTENYLTSRELEVLQLLGTGLDNQAIAEALQISKHTVKFHLSSIFAKLEVSSRTAAVTLGLRQGLIRL